MPFIPSFTTLAAAVRDHFDLSQAEIARYLGGGRGQVTHLEAGRRRRAPLVNLRLVRLARRLPPPEGTGPPAPTAHAARLILRADEKRCLLRRAAGAGF